MEADNGEPEQQQPPSMEPSNSLAQMEQEEQQTAISNIVVVPTIVIGQMVEEEQAGEVVEEEQASETKNESSSPPSEPSRRRRNQQKHVPRTNRRRIVAQCPQCKIPFPNMMQYQSHLVDEHNVELGVQKHEFANQESFEAWKAKLEHETCHTYVVSFQSQINHQPKYRDVRKMYFCSRMVAKGKQSKGKPGKNKNIKKDPGELDLSNVMCCPAHIEISYKVSLEMSIENSF